MDVDAKEIIREVAAFFRFDLRRRGHIIDVRPLEKGWEVQAEVLDLRPDLSTSYKQVFDQNIYRVRVTEDLKISSCEKIGTREKDGEIRFFPQTKAVPKPPSSRLPSQKLVPEKKVSLDPSLVGNLADEISKRVSSSLARKKGIGSEEEPAIDKEVFIDPHEEAHLDFNFERVGKPEHEEEGDLPEAVERLKEVTSRGKPKEKGSLP